MARRPRAAPGNPQRSAAALRLHRGASLLDDLVDLLAAAGFGDIRIEPEDTSREPIRDWAPGRAVEDSVVSAATIEALKPSV